MKKSQMVRKLVKFLKPLENCMLRPKEAREIIDFLTTQGMLPPDQNANAEAPCAVLTYWEKEKK
jgi:hypothetical protein